MKSWVFLPFGVLYRGWIEVLSSEAVIFLTKMCEENDFVCRNQLYYTIPNRNALPDLVPC